MATAAADLFTAPTGDPAASRTAVVLRFPLSHIKRLPRLRRPARPAWRIATIDRYLFRLAALRMLAIIVVVVAIMTLENGPRLAADLQHADAPWALLGMLSADLLPEHLAIAIPVATLLAIATTVRTLVSRGEWQVLAASGMSPARIMVAPVALALLAAGAMMTNSLVLRPLGERQLDALYTEVALGAHGIALPLREPIALDAHTTLVAQAVAADAPGVLTDVLIRRDATVITAARAAIARAAQGGIALQLGAGVSVARAPDGTMRRLAFDRLTLHGTPPGLGLVPGNLRHRLDRASGAGLWRIATGAATPALRHAAAAGLAGRIEAALFCLLLPWLAVAVGAPPRRRAGGPALMIGIVLIVLHLQTAALVEDQFATHAVIAGVLHAALWIGLTAAVVAFARRREGAIDLAITDAAAAVRRWLGRTDPAPVIARSVRAIRSTTFAVPGRVPMLRRVG